jgi:lipoprotein-anchoring transpeptidase ErfK/SrfK
MLQINSFRSVGAVLVAAGAILSSAAAVAQPLALNDPNPRFPASIFQQAMPEEATVAEPEEATERVPAHLRRQIVNYSGREAAGTIVIDTPNTYLYYVLGGGKAMRYGIGVGREGFTWSGTQSISRKTEWPDWIPPQEMLQRQPYLPRFMAGGPGNPLGARAMYLGSTIYRIHGTNAPSTIGGRVSSGCIRMLNEDVTDLYGRVNVGTKVVVLPMGPRSAPIAEAPARVRPVSAAPARMSATVGRGVY